MRLFPSRLISSRKLDESRWCLWRWVDIIKGGESYLARLIVLRTPWFQVLLHWINKPDEDGALHDHPWSFLSILLSGSYVEDRGRPSSDKRWLMDPVRKTVRFFNFKRLRDAHQIVAMNGNVITLILTGRRKKSWGFYECDYDRSLKQPDIIIPVNYTPWREFLDRHPQLPQV